MKKYIMILTLITIILLNLSLVLSLSVENCKSNEEDWECVEDEICICDISGTCTDGNLLIYEDDVSNMLCMPEVDDNEVEINWDSCDNPIGYVKVRVYCDEGQSDEEELYIIEAGAVTTTLATTIQETTTTSEFEVTTTIEKDPCPIDWECCEDESYYEDEPCPVGMGCCSDHVCREDCGIEEGGFNFGIVAGFILVIIIAFLIYSFYIKKRGRMSFKKLYEKWT